MINGLGCGLGHSEAIEHKEVPLFAALLSLPLRM
jgi:hypothetical protein